MTIEEHRKEIDHIDSQLTLLLQKRLRVAGEIAEIKAREGLPIQDPAREKALLTARVKTADPALAPYVDRFFQSLLTLSKDYQKDHLRK